MEDSPVKFIVRTFSTSIATLTTLDVIAQIMLKTNLFDYIQYHDADGVTSRLTKGIKSRERALLEIFYHATGHRVADIPHPRFNELQRRLFERDAAPLQRSSWPWA